MHLIKKNQRIFTHTSSKQWQGIDFLNNLCQFFFFQSVQIHKIDVLFLEKKNGNLQTTRIDLPTQAAKSSGNYMRPFHSRTCWQWNDVKCESHELIGQPRKTFSPNNKRKLPTAGRRILLCIDQGDRDDMYDMRGTIESSPLLHPPTHTVNKFYLKTTTDWRSFHFM